MNRAQLAIRHGLVEPRILLERLASTAIEPTTRASIARQIEADAAR